MDRDAGGGGKRDVYETKFDIDDLEALQSKLQNDLRKHIRNLGSYEVLSPPWCAMADTVARVAHVSSVERTMESDSDNPTLWESEELALQFIMEDAKLNICLRALVDFKAYARTENPAAEQREAMTKFEKGMGIMLRNVWQHEEAMQTTDQLMLLDHIAATVNHAVQTAVDDFMWTRDESDVRLSQEVLVFQYVSTLFRHMEQLDEGRLVAAVRDSGIFSTGIRFLHKFSSVLPADAIVDIANALGHITQAEDFTACQDEFFQDRVVEGADMTTQEALVEIMDDVLKEMMKGPMDTRRKLRPLSDLAMRLRRSRRK